MLQIFSGVVRQTRDLHLSCSTLYLSSPRLCFFIVIKLDLSVDREDMSRVRGWSCEPNNQLNVCTTSVTEGEVGPVKLV